jgi:hypothetical protein
MMALTPQKRMTSSNIFSPQTAQSGRTGRKDFPVSVGKAIFSVGN